MNKVMKWGAIFIITVGLLSIARFYYFLNTAVSDNTEKVVFEIPPGDGLNSIAIKLKKRGLLSDIGLFKLYVYLSRGVHEFKAGEYHLSPSNTPAEIYDILISGLSILYDLVVPEGYNIYQIAELLDAQHLGNPKTFLEMVKKPEVISSYDLHGRSLEGYLFPSTYKFSKTVTTEKIIRTMVEKFRSVYQTSFAKRAKEIGFSMHDVITLASIVEKETGFSGERPVIASVFHNRLKKRMRLESDPTVIYGIENFNGNLTRKDLQTRTPYNTYRIFGLPEGPIANPGLEAIKAVLWPEQTPYLFFVSKNDGTHVFSKTFKEHQKWVTHFQKIRKNRAGKSWRDLNKKLQSQ